MLKITIANSHSLCIIKINAKIKLIIFEMVNYLFRRFTDTQTRQLFSSSRLFSQFSEIVIVVLLSNLSIHCIYSDFKIIELKKLHSIKIKTNSSINIILVSKTFDKYLQRLSDFGITQNKIFQIHNIKSRLVTAVFTGVYGTELNY